MRSFVWMTGIVAAIGGFFSPLSPLAAQTTLQNAICDQLWIARNSIFARKGHCFGTPQAQAYFGIGCFPPYGQLDAVEQELVNAIIRWEGLKGCNISFPSPLPSSVSARIDVFVMAGGQPSLDACPGVGEVSGLNPRGDGFLSVRSGPGGSSFREIDRLYNGQRAYVCDQRGPWLGVVYETQAQGGVSGCGVMTPWGLRQPYTGPCRYGWIHSNYLRPIGG